MQVDAYRNAGKEEAAARLEDQLTLIHTKCQVSAMPSNPLGPKQNRIIYFVCICDPADEGGEDIHKNNKIITILGGWVWEGWAGGRMGD